MPNTFRNCPRWAHTTKEEYRKIRNFVFHTAHRAGFDETGLWNLVIEKLEKRHANFLRGRAKTDWTLADAADAVCKAAYKERMKMVNEQVAAREAVSA